jgi:hypothetical protein
MICQGRREAIMMNWFLALQYSHWLIITGTALVAIGFVGFAFDQNRNGQPEENPRGTGQG